ncbi:MAG: hypothetical protein JWM64_632 [Frankiales bacterium]|nr:hypothetical protein [Frankiales bacterium]
MGRSRVTDEQLREAAARAGNLRQLLDSLGLAGRGANYALYRRRLVSIGVLDPRFQVQPRAQPPGERDLQRVAPRCTSVSAVCRALDLPVSARWNARVRDLLVLHGIDTSHFLGKRSNLGRTDLPPRGRPLEELLRRGSRISSSSLRRRLLKEGLLDASCRSCGLTLWQGRPVPLELDHVNGDNTDNRLENLRLLCPNCHALTDTYRGRNVGRAPYAGVEPP